MTHKHVLQIFKLSLPLANKLQVLRFIVYQICVFVPEKIGHLPLNVSELGNLLLVM